MGCYADNFSDELNNKRKLDSDFHFHEEEKKTKGKNVYCVHIIELSILIRYRGAVSESEEVHALSLHAHRITCTLPLLTPCFASCRSS